MSVKMLRALGCVLLCALAATAGARQRGINAPKPGANQRVALVIGNGAYATAPLKNPVNDARAMAQALRELGFEVIYEENLSQNDMKRAIRAFGGKVRNSGVRLFYYAGHGMQVNGENFLIPVDAKFGNEREVEYEGVNAGLVLAQMEESEDSINIVILDACRNNPFARSFRSATRGLAAVSAPSGTLIAYATAPGSVASDGDGENGLYTQELLRYMRAPGLSVEEIFKQVRVSVRGKTRGQQTPWESSSLTGEFYFSGGRRASGQSAGEVPAPKTDSGAMELSFWDSIKNSEDPEDFKAYLERYPDGTFAPLARRRMQALRGKTAAGNTGAQPSGAQPGSPAVQTARAKFFTFNLQQCRTSGATVTCDLTITNDEGAERPLSFYRLDAGRVSKAFDDQGAEIRMTGNRIANRNAYEETTLVNGVNVRASATFEGLSPRANSIKLLTLWFNTIAQGFIVDSFKVEYRDVPLTR